MSDEPLVPQQPEYEEIIIRELSFGFPGGETQDITVYPEDNVDTEGDTVFIIFNSMRTEGVPLSPTWRVKVAPGMWISDRYAKHRRVKGTLRPTPKDIMDTFKRNREQERRQRLQGAVADMIRMGTVGSDYNPNE